MSNLENRTQVYLQLIQAILACKSDEELNQLLNSNSNLIDEGLIQTMLTVAENIDDENMANYLRRLANSLIQYFSQNNSNSTGEDYEGFWRQLIQIVIENNGNPEIVYPFLRQNLQLINLNLIPILQQFWRNTLPNLETSQREYLAAIFNDLGNLFGQFPFNKHLAIENAIACYQKALEERRQDNVPLDWAMTQNNLANAYLYRIAGERRENLENAIACYQKALEEWRQDNVPLEWAITQNNLANAYLYRIAGDRRENLENAIACYQKALEERRQDNVPLDWAMTQNNLANAYLYRIAGDRRENLENAIACYQKALEERRQDNVPLDWAMTQNNLANAYLYRIAGERRENLENAIACYQKALEEWRQDNVPLEWAITQNNLAIAYSDRIAGDRRENLENAIACYQKALEERRQDNVPLDWAMTQNNLANAYLYRIAGDRRENLENAIACYQKAVEEWRQDNVPLQWAITQNNLAAAYSERIAGDRRENLEKAIACYQKALEERRQDNVPLDWASTQNNLANAYSERIAGDRRENLEKAITCYQKALEERRQDNVPLDWASTQNNLANAYSERIAGDRMENLEKAIVFYTLALKERRQDNVPLDWASTQNNLANAYSERIAGDRMENLEKAIVFYTLALKEWRQDNVPLDWASTQNNLANAYSERIAEDRRENLEKAIIRYENALKERKPDNVPLDCLQTRRNLGNLYYQQKNWQEAIKSYEIAIEIVESSRVLSLDEERRQEIIGENISLYENMIQSLIEIDEIDKAIEYVESSRSRRLADILVSKDSYADAEIPEKVKLWQDYQSLQQQINRLISNRHQDYNPADKSLLSNQESTSETKVLAIQTKIEQVKARNEAINKEIADLEARKHQKYLKLRRLDPVFAQQTQPPKLDKNKLQSLVPDSKSAIISFFTTQEDTHIFVIRQTGEIKALRCQGQGLNKLMIDEYRFCISAIFCLLNNKYCQLLNFYFHALIFKYKRIQIHVRENWLIPYLLDRSQWQKNIPRVMKHLAEKLQINKLIKNYLQDIEQLILVPHLDLHLIPLAILPIKDDKYQYLGDKYTIRTLPSCLILKFCSEYAPIEITKTALVENATDDLFFASYECRKIDQMYQGKNKETFSLIGSQQATIQKYQQLLEKEQINHLHSSHHASSRLDNPLESALRLGDGLITLGDILFWRLPNLSLVFLSCCETALGTNTKTRNDEIVTLAAAFLCAGARIVISTLWAVNELATALFCIFFYEELETNIPPIAVKKAQEKLRNFKGENIKLYRNEIIATVKPIIEQNLKATKTKIEQINQKITQLKLNKSKIEYLEDEKETILEKKQKTADKSIINQLEKELDDLQNQRYELESEINKNNTQLEEQKSKKETYSRKLNQLERILNRKASQDFPFEDEVYWAGFVCQGLEMRDEG